ncbi:4-alpha-glucanotransferase [Microbacterium sp. BWT-B31]|uniref:4-alpha-glucanotransferase n=1 Tax=Microbacterium sp. BWT-B31 TaxID=3232072 RepID=UPI003529A48F
MTGDDTPTPALAALAQSYGVATSYWSFFGDLVEVPATTLKAVLRAMGADASTDESVEAALAERETAPWRELLPPSIVVREGGGEFFAHVADAHDAAVSVGLEDGSWRDIPIPEQQPEAREVDGARVWRLRVALPADLPLGWHTLHARQWDRAGAEDRTATAVLAVTPALAPPPSRPGRAWGLMAQLYSVRSRSSWGMGDFADLGDLAAIAGARGADFLLINPVHAADVVSPVEASPYRPSTRRFLAALYVRPDDIREVAYLSPSARAAVTVRREQTSAMNTDPDLIDRDLVWAAKRDALESVFAAARSPAREASLRAFVARGGQALADFALWCAIEEHFAQTPVEDRPGEASDLHSDLVAGLRETLAARIAFHQWLQWVADEQLERAQRDAREAGMRIGIMHDLAVGVNTSGADAWTQRDLYAPATTVGAPPDMYNQQGQNWNQPPWLPDALARVGYAPLRDTVRGLLRHAGALRVDHILGFFRLWWIPSGFGADAGTYVRYDHEAMIGVLALEAHRAGAVVIGEDLGNVEPWVRDYLSERGILGTSVLWFEGGGLTPPEQYRRAVLATVNTHDLPPTAGYLAGEHVTLRARLGLLTRTEQQERADAVAERDAVLKVLRERGLIGDSPSVEEIVAALHAYLAAAPSELLGVALVDAVGERRVQNQPGTDKEYPNWKVPLADSSGAVVLLDDLAANARFVALTGAVEEVLRRR